jgi:hypothetical protein
LAIVSKRRLYAVWVVVIGIFAVMHAVNLAADFPNHTIWHIDWAKYTDEGWYGNAAIRAHLFGQWYVPGDFNPAPAVPVWPFLEWVLFFFTGVTVEAARGLAVAMFFANLALIYWLLRPRGPKWMALVALTLMVTSPFLYCFSRLAVLEPLLTTLLLLALNLAVRLPRSGRPIVTSAAIGVLFTLMMLTKTTAVFLAPAIGWAIFAAFREGGEGSLDIGGLRPQRWLHQSALRCAGIVIPVASVLLMAILARAAWFSRQKRQGVLLLMDPVFGACVLSAGGYIIFMTYQNHPQPRYFAVVAVFCFSIVAMAMQAMMAGKGLLRWLGLGAAAVTAWAVAVNGAQTASFAMHPEYTFVTAARELTAYIDKHPNGNRLLVSISGDEITLITHIHTLCDDFSMHTPAFPDLGTKLAIYKPGWWATWNDIDPGTLEDLHTHFSLEQVAEFQAFDDPERNVLVLFKLHPLPDAQARLIKGNNLQQVLPDDKILIPIE